MPRGVYLRTEEQKAKLRVLFKGKHHTEETRKKISQSLKGRCPSEEQRARLRRYGSSSFLGKHHRIESRIAMSQAATGRRYSEDTKRLLSRLLVKRFQDPKARAKMSQSLKQLFADSEYRERVLKAVRLGSHLRPTKPEATVISLLEQHFPNEWKYVGDGQFMLGGKNPDFLNVNGRKKLIEVFGVYWHDVFDVAERTEHFRSYGFQTLVIWEDELNNENKVVKKIQRFSRAR